MADDQTWVAARLSQARNEHPSVTVDAIALMSTLLLRDLSDHALPAALLKRTAQELLNAMGSSQPETPTKE
jgi:hypothetical protein